MKHKASLRPVACWVPIKKNRIQVIRKKSKNTIATFQRALKVTLFLGQLFSLLPVVGVFSNDVRNVKFVRASWRCVYLSLSLIGQFFMVMLILKMMANSVVSLQKASFVIFYGTSFATTALFLQVARRWPALVQHINKTEEFDPLFSTNLTAKCNITCAVVLGLALLEHLLSLLSTFARGFVCSPQKFTYEEFLMFDMPWVFNILPYSLPLGIISHFLHFQSTFIWNFSDLFVICMSYYLTSRLHQINIKLLEAKGKYLPEIFWRTIREDYCRITQLVKRVDDVISAVVFVSFANNLFFICLQLYNTLEYGFKSTAECSSKSNKTGLLGGHEDATYYLFSLLYLLSRSIAVSLIASQVNYESNVPASVLYEVPSPVYCVEVQRFLDQVTCDKVALSGLQFFYVTRGLLLTIAGTIVTYELVMFQFNSSAPPEKTTLPPIATNATTNITKLF